MDMNYQKEHRIIGKLAQMVIALVDRDFGKPRTVSAKSSAGDVVTDLDKKVDSLITDKLRAAFPRDHIVSEESSAHAVPKTGRAWVIDPICGTSNLAHGIRFFATNIALVNEGKMVAAWVIDHAQHRLISALGNKWIRSGGKRIPRLAGDANPVMIDVDWGYWHDMEQSIQTRYASLARDLKLNNKIWIRSFNTSLSFTYIATGQLDAAIVINVYPWDLLAPCFLIEQNGGIATNFDGSPYTIHSKSVVMARNRKIHIILLRMLKQHKLDNIR